MGITDIFSPTFLFSSLIIIILVGGIFSYVSYRMAEQDHKLSSMIGLVSHMNEELQYFRSKIDTPANANVEPMIDSHKMLFVSQLLGGNKNINDLITVSDDGSDNESFDTNADEDSVDDLNEDLDEDDSVEDLDEDDSVEDLDEDDSVEELDEDDSVEELDEDDSVEELDDKCIQLNINDNNDLLVQDSVQDIIQSAMLYQPEIKTIHLEEPIHLMNDDVLNNDNDNEEAIDNDNDHSFLKSVSVNYLDDDAYKHYKPDYKKMSINKLREIAIEKELTIDASKLKKHDILKMLGDE
jgi:hypothetical protein